MIHEYIKEIAFSSSPYVQLNEWAQKNNNHKSTTFNMIIRSFEKEGDKKNKAAKKKNNEQAIIIWKRRRTGSARQSQISGQRRRERHSMCAFFPPRSFRGYTPSGRQQLLPLWKWGKKKKKNMEKNTVKGAGWTMRTIRARANS